MSNISRVIAIINQGKKVAKHVLAVQNDSFLRDYPMWQAIVKDALVMEQLMKDMSIVDMIDVFKEEEA